MAATPADIAEFTNDGRVVTAENPALRGAHPEALDMLGEPMEMFYDTEADGQAVLGDLFALLSKVNPAHEGIELDENLRIGQTIAIAPTVPCFRIVDEERGLDVTARLVAPAPVMIQPAMLVVPAQVISWQDLGTTLAGYPVSNLGVDAPVPWVSKSPAPSDTHSFVAEIGPQPIDTIALLMSNVGVDATVTVQAYDTGETNVYNFGPVAFRASSALPARPGYHALIRLPAPMERRYWRINIVADVFMDQLHLDHAVFGLNRVTKNHSVDKSEQGIDLGTLERTRAGNPVRMLGARGRRVDFDISMLTEAAFDQAYGDLDWCVGTTQPILCVPNSLSNAFLHDRILYGALRGGRTINPASPVYTRSFSIDSII